MNTNFKFLSSLSKMISAYLIPLALGISLSACCGFRIFTPLLIASLAAKLGWINLSEGFEWVGTFPTILAFATASVLEVLAYYIPVVDNFLDTLTTPSSVVAGTIISASVFVDFDPMLKWTLAIIAGGGTAGIIQAGTGLLRFGSTKLTAGTGNHLIATGENIFSVVGSLFALILPVVMAVLTILSAIVIVWFFVKKFVSPEKRSSQA